MLKNMFQQNPSMKAILDNPAMMKMVFSKLPLIQIPKLLKWPGKWWRTMANNKQVQVRDLQIILQAVWGPWEGFQEWVPLVDSAATIQWDKALFPPIFNHNSPKIVINLQLINNNPTNIWEILLAWEWTLIWWVSAILSWACRECNSNNPNNHNSNPNSRYRSRRNIKVS